MLATILPLLGALGVFLLGVSIMTSGLKALAGECLHRLLARFTRSPLSGAVSGAATTAILQSSSATTVAAVGFVGAGLLSFSQALGVVLGANLGTTVTGWLVALIGFKLQLGQLLMPLILIGVLLHLFAHGARSAAGLALAGFGLVFVGIEAMQSSMSGLDEQWNLAQWAGEGWLARLRLLFVGLVITLITQSSSAGVAAALAAVYTGTISFEQAAALVIGMDVGTTATAALATVGGSVETRRTGYSHVLYNLMTGVLAFFLLDFYRLALDWHWPLLILNDPELALVGFHSLFNLLGVLLILPFAGAFAAGIEKLVPERSSAAVRMLDSRLWDDPVVALEAAQSSWHALLAQVIDHGALTMQGRAVDSEDIAALDADLRQLQTFLDGIHLPDSRHPQWLHLSITLHGMDHLRRLWHRLRSLSASDIRSQSALSQEILGLFKHFREQAEQAQWSALNHEFQQHFLAAEADSDKDRERQFQALSRGEMDVPQADQALLAIRWRRRVLRHLWKLAQYGERLSGFSLRPDPLSRFATGPQGISGGDGAEELKHHGGADHQ